MLVTPRTVGDRLVHSVNTRNDKNKTMIPEKTLFFIACPAFFPLSLPPSCQVLSLVYASATLRPNRVSGTPSLTFLLSSMPPFSAVPLYPARFLHRPV